MPDQLAVDGGDPVRSTPLPGRKLMTTAERDAVMALMDRAIAEGSHLVGYGGEQETAYCQAFAEYQGGGYADAVNSGTNAVYLALRCLDPEPYSEIIVPPITDPGGVMPVAMMNCIPVIADAAPGSFNAGAEQIEACISSRTAAILVAHIAGVPADLGPILELAERHGIPVVEDCAQAHGATYDGRMVGSLGRSAAFSTMFGKHHCTGGQGGVVFTRDESVYWRQRQVADRGKALGTDGSRGNVVASLNFNLSEIDACIGRVQLARLPEFVATRQARGQEMQSALAELNMGVSLMAVPERAEASWWFLPLQFDPACFRFDKATIATALQAEGIGVGPSYWHCAANHAWWQDRKVFGSSQLPWSATELSERAKNPIVDNARATADYTMILGIHEGWTAEDIDDTVSAIRKVATAYQR